MHDLTFLLTRFANLESLSVDSGGGSAEHNLKLIPFMIQMIMYLMDEYDDHSKRDTFEKVLSQYLTNYNTIAKKIDQSGYYNMVLSILLMNLDVSVPLLSY
jgi:hypothetical protein